MRVYDVNTHYDESVRIGVCDPVDHVVLQDETSKIIY